MEFLTFWLMSTAIAFLIGTLEAWWLHRHNMLGTISLADLIIGIGLCVIPIVNDILIFGLIVMFFSEIGPKITVFGDKK